MMNSRAQLKDGDFSADQELSVLIVDDEWPARKRLSDLLTREPGIKVVAQCSDGNQALDRLSSQRVDLIFLDIKMPGLDGFDLLERIPPGWGGVVVFVTAFDRYAIRAFDAHAVDYLLKPFDDERFFRAVASARDELLKNQLHERHQKLEVLKRAMRQSVSSSKKIELASRGRSRMVELSMIQWVRAAGVYVEISLGAQQLLVRQSVKELISLLPREQFARIHRGTIVNIDAVGSVTPLRHGDAQLELTSGITFRVSRRYRRQLLQRIGERNA